MPGRYLELKPVRSTFWGEVSRLALVIGLEQRVLTLIVSYALAIALFSLVVPLTVFRLPPGRRPDEPVEPPVDPVERAGQVFPAHALPAEDHPQAPPEEPGARRRDEGALQQGLLLPAHEECRGDALLESNPLPVVVRELPKDGELPGFTGAIGVFSLDPSRLSTNEVLAGDALTLSVTVRGDGNIGRLIPPKIPILRE